MRNSIRLCSLGAALVLSLAAGMVASGAAAAEKMSFESDVFPILQIRCLACHKPGDAGHDQSGLDLRTYKTVMKGTKHGPMIVAGDPFMSNLIVLVEGRADPALRMPHGGKKLTKCEIDILRKWIKQGAKDN